MTMPNDWNPEVVEVIPADFPVRPVATGTVGDGIATDGYCGLSWDDNIVTGWTPAPSARCPFEPFHIYPDEAKKRYTVIGVYEDPAYQRFADTYEANSPQEAESLALADADGLIIAGVIEGDHKALDAAYTDGTE